MRHRFVLTTLLSLIPGLLFAQVPEAREPGEDNAEKKRPLELKAARFSAWWPGTDEESRWLAVRARVTNDSDGILSVPLTAWKLKADGETYPIQPLTKDEDASDLTIFIGDDVMSVTDFKVEELSVPSGESAETWLTFSGMPPGTHVPEMTLTCQLDDNRQLTVDVNAAYAERLKLDVERLGPGNGLALLSIAGEIDTINVGAFARTIDGLVNDGLTRFVVVLPDDSTDFQILDWLQQVARTSGQSEMYHDLFPDLPAEQFTLHLVHPTSEDQQSGDTWWDRNIYCETDEAVVAALGPLCRQAPRGALLSELREGHPLSRAAALIYGAEHLAADDLPSIIRMTRGESANLREAATFALRHFGEQDAIAELIRLAGSDDSEVAGVAVESLAQSRYSVAHGKLIELLETDNETLRGRVVDAMAQRPRAEWSGPLYRLAVEGNDELRLAVLSALTAVGHPKLHTLLRESLNDDDATLSAAALEQLMKHDDPESERLALQWTLRRLEDSPPSRTVLRFLQRTRDTRAVPLLMKHIGDEPSKERQLLVSTILNIGDERAAEELGKRFDSLKTSERMLVLGSLRSVGSPMFRELAENVMRGKSTKVVEHMAGLLAEDASPWAIGLIEEAMRNAMKKKRYSALCVALAQASTPEARDILRKAAGPDGERFRNRAKEALEMLYQSSPAFQFVVQGQSAWQDDENQTLALLYLDLAVEVDPELPIARMERGNTLMRLTDATPEHLQKAREDFSKLVDIDADDVFGRTGLALVDVRLGSIERGIEAGEKLRETNGEDPLFLYNMACVYGRAIDSLEAQDNPPENLEEQVREYQEKAISDLRGSIEFGLDEYNTEWMTRDPDLEAVRRHPSFEDLFEEAESN